MAILYTQCSPDTALTQNVVRELYFYGECIYSILWLCVDNVMFGASVKDVMLRNMIFVVMLLTFMPLLNTIKILSNMKWTPLPRSVHVWFVCTPFRGWYLVTTSNLATVNALCVCTRFFIVFFDLNNSTVTVMFCILAQRLWKKVWF